MPLVVTGSVLFVVGVLGLVMIGAVWVALRNDPGGKGQRAADETVELTPVGEGAANDVPLADPRVLSDLPEEGNVWGPVISGGGPHGSWSLLMSPNVAAEVFYYPRSNRLIVYSYQRHTLRHARLR